MSGASSIKQLLNQDHTFVLDGGLATALEEKGYNLVNPLWSACLLPSDTQAIQDLHVAFYRAGADFAITASYQASTKGLVEHLGVTYENAKELVRKSAQVAVEAREEAKRLPDYDGRPLYVAGSIGAYGAYLANGAEGTGEYGQISEKDIQDFHRDRMRILLDAGVDILACETVPSILEIKALCNQLAEEFPHAVAWLSCSLRDATHIGDGSDFAEVVKLVDGCDQIIAIGFNCMSIEYSAEALAKLQSLTKKPLVIYPNSGETYDAVKKAWFGVNSTPAYLEGFASDSHSLGARFIGGCCRIGCKEILAMSRALHAINSDHQTST